jgi:hypothetical protein
MFLTVLQRILTIYLGRASLYQHINLNMYEISAALPLKIRSSLQHYTYDVFQLIRLIIYTYTGAGVVFAEKQSPPLPSLRAHCYKNIQ